MTNEEIKKGICALEYTKAMISFDPITGEDRSLNEEDERTVRGCEAGIKALKMIEKCRWHDLRKNPNDLPKCGEVVEIVNVNGEHDFMFFNDDFEKSWFYASSDRDIVRPSYYVAKWRLTDEQMDNMSVLWVRELK